MKFLFLPADQGACSHYRCRNMAKALTLAGVDAMVLDQPLMMLTKEWDVVVIQRQYHQEVTYNVDRWHENGQLVFYEVDDLLTELPAHNPASWTYTEHEAQILKFLRECDGLIVSTEPLARELSKYNKNILVVKNHMDLDFWKSARQKNGLKVGWQGGPTHVKDLDEIKGIPDRLDAEILTIGMRPVWARDKGWTHRGFFPFEATPAYIADLDIGMAPLTKGRFNDCKSAIKFMEYALFGTPTVASDTGPYARTIIHGETGYLAKNGKDWLKYLNRLVKDEGLRREMGERAREWVIENRSIQTQYQRIADQYVDYAESYL